MKKLLLGVLVAILLIAPIGVLAKSAQVSVEPAVSMASGTQYKSCVWSIKDGWGRLMGRVYIQSTGRWVTPLVRFTYATGWVANATTGGLSKKSFVYHKSYQSQTTATLKVRVQSWTFWPFSLYEYKFKLRLYGDYVGHSKCSYSKTRLR